jgi:hypothetical protein
MAIDTMTAIDIGNVGSGRNAITITGSGTMLGTITTGIAATGGMTITAVALEATGTTSMKVTAVEVSINTNGTGSACRNSRKLIPHGALPQAR